MTFLKELESEDEEDRYESKFYLIRSLYEKGYGKEDVLMLYEFIDWMMRLPDGLERKLHEEIERLEEVKKVRYITTAERIGMEKGLEKGREEESRRILKGLIKAKFKKLPEELERLIDESTVDKIEEVALRIFDIESIEEVEEILRS